MGSRFTNPAETLPDGPWIDMLDTAYLGATHPDWASPQMTIEQAAAAFREHGFPTLAALAEELDFDPAYFREVSPAWEAADDLTCYRAWLLYGVANGQHPSGSAHLRKLQLPAKQYPPGFPWAHYARLRPQAGAHRWAALDDFFAMGGYHTAPPFPLGPGGGGLLCSVARIHSLRNDKLAIGLYEQARLIEPMPPSDQQHLADAYLREGLFRPAADLYREVIAQGEPNGWTFRNLVKCAVQLGELDDVLVELERARPSEDKEALWDGTVDLAVESLFENRSQHTRALMADGDYIGADRYLTEAVQLVADVLERLSPISGAREGTANKILILANQDDPERAERRVRERARLLNHVGMPHEVVTYTEPEPFMAALSSAALTIFFRVPALPRVISCVLAARRLATPCCYESDTLLSEPDEAPSIDEFRGRISSAEYDDLRFGITLQRAAARFCDIGIAPTERLADGLRRQVRGQCAFIVRDSLPPSLTTDRAETAVEVVQRLFLRVASLTHIDADAGTIGEQLLHALRRWPRVELCVSGPLHLDIRFDTRAGQIRNVGHASTPPDYLPLLALSDINLAISNGSAEDEYRAELSWAEAAAVGVPSLLYLPQGGPADLQAQADMISAADPESWLEALARLLADRGLRTRIGAAAKIAARARYGPDAAAREFGAVLAHAFGSALLQNNVKEAGDGR